MEWLSQHFFPSRPPHAGPSGVATSPSHQATAFDTDTSLERTEKGWRAEIGNRWDIGTNPNGGFLLALALKALTSELPQTEPLTATAHYLRRLDKGPVDIVTDVIRVGRSTATAMAMLVQDGRERVRVLATFRGVARGTTAVAVSPPQLPPPGECRELPVLEGGLLPEMFNRFDLRLSPSVAGWLQGTPTGQAVVERWIRFRDGRAPDVASVPLFADAFPPAVFDVTGPTWVPTLELTVHLRGKPATGWLAGSFRTRFLIDGVFEEDGELWDSGGRLVAQSRQLALALAVG